MEQKSLCYFKVKEPLAAIQHKSAPESHWLFGGSFFVGWDLVFAYWFVDFKGEKKPGGAM